MRETRVTKASAVGIVVLAALALTGACNEAELDSLWTTETVDIDGMVEVDDEWTGAMTSFEDQDVSVGLLNDAEFLYVSLIAPGPVGRQAMVAGLTVWIDPKGGTDEWHGIRFPVPPTPPEGADRGSGRFGGFGGFGRSGGDTQRGQRGRARPGREAGPGERLRMVELVGPGEISARQLPRPVGGGLEVDMRSDGATFVYELKVPLPRDDDHRMGIGVEAGDQIGVGFETGNLRDQIGRGRGGGRGAGGGGRGGGFGGGGRGGGGGGGRGGGGRGGGPGGDDRPDRPDPLKLWARVQLSAS